MPGTDSTTWSPGATDVTVDPIALNDPGPFVAEHRRQRHRKVLMPRVGVRLANAARHHPDQHLIGARFVEL